MAYKIINVKYTGKGSVSLDTVKGLVALDAGESASGLRVTEEQLARIATLPDLTIIAGNTPDAATSFLGLPLERDLNVNVFDQGKINEAFEKIDNMIALLSAAASGHIFMVVEPDTSEGAVEIELPDQDFTVDVTLKLVDLEGNIHTWFNMPFADFDTTSSTTSQGTITLATDNSAFVNGVCQVTFECTGTWAKDEVIVIDVDDISNIMGYEIAGGSSTFKLVAPEPEESGGEE